MFTPADLAPFAPTRQEADNALALQVTKETPTQLVAKMPTNVHVLHAAGTPSAQTSKAPLDARVHQDSSGILAPLAKVRIIFKIYSPHSHNHPILHHTRNSWVFNNGKYKRITITLFLINYYHVLIKSTVTYLFLSSC